MKNVIFITAGLTLVVIIVVATLLYEQPAEPAVPLPEDQPPVVTPEPEPQPQPEEPVFVPEDITQVNVYFSNAKQNPEATDCAVVYPVVRDIEPTPAVAKESLDQLLAGVTAEEKTAGYSSSINTQARVVSVAVEQGVATIEFNHDFQNGMAGACKVTAARAQIETTLKQFPTVKDVVIKVEGVPDEEVLQP